MTISVSFGGAMQPAQTPKTLPPSPAAGAQALQVPMMPHALAALDQYGKLKNECSESPIFILAAGWRSGSTLLQRLVVSGGDTLIWGEPFGTSAMIRLMSEPLRRVPRELGPSRQLESYPKEELSQSWIANLYPPVDKLLRAHQAYWNTLLAEPAYEAGYKRWGLKEVRLDVQQIAYLRWLYPNAQFVMLIRNPYDAYISYRNAMNVWFETWPDKPINSPMLFGQQWQRLANDYLNNHKFLGAPLLRYEEIQAKGAHELSEYLQMKFDEKVFEKKIKGLHKEGAYQMGPQELEALTNAVNPLAASLGYTGTTPKTG